MSTWLFSFSLLSASTASTVVLDFILVLTLSRATIANWLSQFMTTFFIFVFRCSQYEVECRSSHCKNVSLKHNRIRIVALCKLSQDVKFKLFCYIKLKVFALNNTNSSHLNVLQLKASIFLTIVNLTKSDVGAAENAAAAA